MKDLFKPKRVLILELASLTRRIEELEESESLWKKEREELKKSEARFRSYFDLPLYGIAISSPEKGWLQVNDRMCSIMGYSRDEFIRMTWPEMTHPDDLAANLEQFNRVLSGQIDYYNMDKRFIRKDGKVVWTHLSVGCVRKPDGRVDHYIVMVEDITSIKLAEEELRDAETRFRLLFQHSPDGILIIDPATARPLEFNEAAHRQLGYSREEFSGLSIFDLEAAETPEETRLRIAGVMQEGRADFETRQRTRQGEIRDVHVTAQFAEIMGQPVYHCVWRDITDRKRAEEALAKSEERFRKAFYTSPDSVNINRLQDGMYVSINPGFTRITGYTEEDIIGKTSIERNIWANVEDRQKLTTGLIKDGEVINLEATFRMKDGDIRYGLMSASIIELDGVPHILSITRDITDRKRAEKALKESENKYRLLADNVNDVIFVLDMNLNYTYVSPSVKMLRGYEPEEVLKQPSLETLTPSSWDRAKRILSEALELEKSGRRDVPKSRTVQLEMVRNDGTTVWTEAKFSLIRDEKQKPVAILGVGRDITERKWAEDALTESESHYHSLFENMLNGFAYCQMLFDGGRPVDFIYLDTNSAFEILTGLKNVVGKKASEVIPGLRESDTELLEIYGRVALTGKPKQFERYVKAMQMWFAVSVYCPKKEHFVAVFDVITKRKRAEEELQRTLESLRNSVGATVQVMVSAIEIRDPYTAGHQSRSTDLARAIAKEMGLPQDRIDGIRMAGSIHDIGKLSVPAEILSKPTKLTELEFSLIKEHARNGYEMLKNVESPWPLAQIVYQHHERMNGSGYPRNLKGDEILMEARILAVSDVVESMASHRPYRPALGIEKALEEIEKNRGILYDDTVADACLRLFREKGFQFR